MELIERDYILCECPLKHLVDFVAKLEDQYEITVSKAPEICLTMVKAEDSVEGQAFFLGEALTTTCEVVIGKESGLGIVLEDQPERAYCIAVLDTLSKLKDRNWPEIDAFLNAEKAQIMKAETEAHTKIMQSAVDFKLMDDAHP
ncbi:phosphonate C-P lyase system protein PhnG [Cyclobacterium xiamenense]|nr:phosphonate C-P lyase system protein PhnG [Cyclobacterium xiamenense]